MSITRIVFSGIVQVSDIYNVDVCKVEDADDIKNVPSDISGNSEEKEPKEEASATKDVGTQISTAGTIIFIFIHIYSIFV